MNWKDLKDINDEIKPGMMLLKNDGSIYIVGDINKEWGLCDCCTGDGFTHYNDELLPIIETIKSS